jgi:hypothetical protein
MAEACIVATARTAGGRKGGRLAGWRQFDLAARILDALVDRCGPDPGAIDDVIRFDASLERVKLLVDRGVVTAASPSQICEGRGLANVTIVERL